MAKDVFGGDPRRFSEMFDLVNDHLYYVYILQQNLWNESQTVAATPCASLLAVDSQRLVGSCDISGKCGERPSGKPEVDSSAF